MKTTLARQTLLKYIYKIFGSSESKKPRIKVIWYCHKCGYRWKGVRFRKRYGRGGRRVSRNICPKCGNRMVTPGFGKDNWLKIRKEALKNANYRCQCCGKTQQIGKPLIVHHMKPVSSGGSSRMENLTVLCNECHKWEHRMLSWVGFGAKYSYPDNISPLWFFPIPILPSLIIWWVYQRRLKCVASKKTPTQKNKKVDVIKMRIKFLEGMTSNIWKKVLGSEEEIKFEFSLADRYVNFQMIPWVIIGIPLLFMGGLGVIPIGFGLFRRWYLKRAHKYAFTNKRVLIHKGWLSTHLTSVDYDKITDMRVEQPFLDKVVYKTGSLAINTAGTGFYGIVLKHIENPFEIRKKLEDIRSEVL